jgi:hypothetical protein
MSAQECLDLQQLGANWYATVNLEANGAQRTTNRNGILGQLAQVLPQHITVRRGFQDYDPVVRVHASAYKYSEIAAWASNRVDGGLHEAQAFGTWMQSANFALTQLSERMQALAVIVFFAEKARNLYNAQQVASWINGVTQATTLAGRRSAWLDYENQFPASLAYKTDVVMDWT